MEDRGKLPQREMHKEREVVNVDHGMVYCGFKIDVGQPLTAAGHTRGS